MRKFISQTYKGITSILEIEVETLGLNEDPSLAWRLKPGETLCKILAPQSLAGEKYYSHFLFDTAQACLDSTISGITLEAERTASKTHTELDTKELNRRIAAIQVKAL